jgi:hypothetical protein
LSDAIAGYFFWLWSKKPWDVNEIRSHFFEKKASEAYEKVRYRLLKIPYARRNAQVDSHKIVELMFLI